MSWETLNKDNIIDFLVGKTVGSVPVPEYVDLYIMLNKDIKKLRYLFKIIYKELLRKYYKVVYPLDMIVIPRYPFTKKPMISWYGLQKLEPYDPQVVRIKKKCSILGNLINTGFILKGYVLIDIDCDKGNVPNEVKGLAQIETKGGYHILFKLKEGIGLRFKQGKMESFKKVFRVSGGQIEVMSGVWYLGSHPLQSRYIDIEEGRISVKSYKILKKPIYNAFKVGDLTILKSDLEDVIETLKVLLEAFGSKEQLSKLEIRLVNSIEEFKELSVNVDVGGSRFNANPKTVLGGLSIKEFKEVLKNKLGMLPKCFREALFGYPPEGTRWFHLRLLVAILPFFVRFTDSEVEELANDFQERVGKRPSELREWVYTIKYYTGITGGLRTPSRYGLPVEAWDTFIALGHCNECPLREKCSKLPPSRRRYEIISYLMDLLKVIT